MRLKRFLPYAGGLVLLLLINVAVLRLDATGSDAAMPLGGGPSGPSGSPLIAAGQQTFRYDTFGDEAFWGDTLHLHQAIEGATLGGVGPGVSPKTALAVGLKVDLDALPASLVAHLKAGTVNLDDPATTLALLKLNAVVGVKGFFNAQGTHLQSIGITCAICHSTVDNAFAPGIGHRLDGWANRGLARVCGLPASRDSWPWPSPESAPPAPVVRHVVVPLVSP